MKCLRILSIVAGLIAVCVGVAYIRGFALLRDVATFSNRLTGFVGEPSNSEEYNAILRLLRLHPAAWRGAPVVSESAKDRSCPDMSFLRPRNTANEVLHAPNEDLEVPFVLTKFGEGDPDLTILYAHGGGMVTMCADMELPFSDRTAQNWMQQLNLPAIQIASVDYRLLPESTMEDALSDFLAVYQHLLKSHHVAPETVVFTGCSGGGSMALFSYMQLLRLGDWPKPGLVVSNSPGPGLEFSPAFPGWENTEQWRSNNGSSSCFMFTREAGRQWGLEWDEESAQTLGKWLADRDLVARIDERVIVTSAQHEMFAAPHDSFAQYAREAGATFRYLSFPNRTHCMQAGVFALTTGRDGQQDLARLFGVVRKVLGVGATRSRGGNDGEQ